MPGGLIQLVATGDADIFHFRNNFSRIGAQTNYNYISEINITNYTLEICKNIECTDPDCNRKIAINCIICGIDETNGTNNNTEDISSFIMLKCCKQTLHMSCLQNWNRIRRNCPFCRTTFLH